MLYPTELRAQTAIIKLTDRALKTVTLKKWDSDRM